MNTSKPRDLLISNISIAESISMFLFKGDFRSVATALSWGPSHSLPATFSVIHVGFGEPVQSKGKEKGPIKKPEKRFLLQKGLFTCFPFAMSGLAFQQLCPESQVQTSFGLHVNL